VYFTSLNCTVFQRLNDSNTRELDAFGFEPETQAAEVTVELLGTVGRVNED